MKSSDCNGKWNGECGTSKEKQHSKSNSYDKLLCKRGVGEGVFCCYVVVTGNIFELNPRGLKIVAESQVGCEGLKSLRGRGQVRRKSEVVHRGGLYLAQVSASATLTRDQDENFRS